MSCEELAETESQQTTSSNKESREGVPSKKSVSHTTHPNPQGQQSQNEPSSTAESSQELKMNAIRRQKELNDKDISNSASAYQSASGRSSSTTAINGVSGVEDLNSDEPNSHIGNNGVNYDQEDENMSSRRQSIHGNSQRSLDSQSSSDIHQRHNSTSSSSLTNITTTNASSTISSPTTPNPTNTNTNTDTNTNTVNINDNNNNNNNNNSNNNNNGVSHPYSNGHNMTYEEIPQMYPNQSAQFIPVAPQYFHPQFLPNNGQFFYDTQYRFGRSPPQLPPSVQPAFLRSNVYHYSQIPVITQMHPPLPYHNHLIQTPPIPMRYLNPSSAGGDSGFSSRRSSLDQIRNPEFGPQHTQMIHQQKKPKELDKALWVGNLPDSTTYEELKDFFADENMESVFLIKKSNCAFVNYKTHEAVVDAAARYNENEFKGIKLVCRPRKQTPADLKKSESLSSLISENTSPPTPSEAGSTASSSTRSRRSSLPPRQRIRQPSVAPMSPASSVSSSKPSSQSRYFILKSLTQDDLDISVQNGLWATQPHNEASLNKAFKSAEHVYLIFSANKSGEFYGYAKMMSPISKEMTETVQWTPIDEAALAASSSRPSTASDELKSRTKKSQDEENEDGEDDGVPSRNWGTTFKIEWIKVQKLPFIRTRHLRNPWNANREVKISRDGTEVEPIVGERLLAEFHKAPLQTVSSPYMPLMLTQPLNIDNQNVSDAQDRRTSLSSQNGAPSLQTPLQPIMDPSFMQNAPPNFCYWHHQPMLVSQYGATTTPQNYQPTWVSPVPKDPSVNRAQTAQTTSVGSTAAMSPMIPLDQQQYVEVIWNPVPQHHYTSTPAQYFSPNSSTTMVSQYQQISQQQYFRNTDDQYQVASKSQEQSSINNDSENDAHITSY